MRAPVAIEDHETMWVRAYYTVKHRWPWWLWLLAFALVGVLAFGIGRLTALYG